jgi:voltage-gated potassium channel
VRVSDAPRRGSWRLPPPRRTWFRFLLPLAALVVLAGGAGLAAFESDTTESYWDGVWWSISLMTTVGWSGDAPTSLAGHLIATATMLVGFLLLAFTTAAVASLFVREDEAPVERRELQADQQIIDELQALRADVLALRREHDHG